jgi:hypothetical protein
MMPTPVAVGSRRMSGPQSSVRRHLTVSWSHTSPHRHCTATHQYWYSRCSQTNARVREHVRVCVPAFTGCIRAARASWAAEVACLGAGGGGCEQGKVGGWVGRVGAGTCRSGWWLQQWRFHFALSTEQSKPDRTACSAHARLTFLCVASESGEMPKILTSPFGRDNSSGTSRSPMSAGLAGGEGSTVQPATHSHSHSHTPESCPHQLLPLLSKTGLD